MRAEIGCPHCGTQFEVHQGESPATAFCTGCGALLTVPPRSMEPGALSESTGPDSSMADTAAPAPPASLFKTSASLPARCPLCHRTVNTGDVRCRICNEPLDIPPDQAAPRHRRTQRERHFQDSSGDKSDAARGFQVSLFIIALLGSLICFPVGFFLSALLSLLMIFLISHDLRKIRGGYREVGWRWPREVARILAYLHVSAVVLWMLSHYVRVLLFDFW